MKLLKCAIILYYLPYFLNILWHESARMTINDTMKSKEHGEGKENYAYQTHFKTVAKLMVGK